MHKKHLRYFELAARAARLSRHVVFRMGAVVVCREHNTVGIGTNKTHQTHPRSKAPYHTIHAELAAVLGIPAENLRGAAIYVVRLTRGGQYATSRPCSFCMTLLQEAGIKKVFYIGENRSFKEEAIDS